MEILLAEGESLVSQRDKKNKLIGLKSLLLLKTYQFKLLLGHSWSFLIITSDLASSKSIPVPNQCPAAPGFVQHMRPMFLYGAADGKDVCLLVISSFRSVGCVHG
jgi:hypothetical protein